MKDWAAMLETLNAMPNTQFPLVPSGRTVNGKPLTTDIVLNSSDINGVGQLSSYPVSSDAEVDSTLISAIKSMGDQTFKRIVLSFTTINNFTGAGGHYYVDIYKLSTNYAMITAKSYIGKGRTVQRIWYAGELNPWEWVNPPMVVGVEYRTTKRWNGKVVYTKLLDCGAAANAKSITYGVTKTRLVDIVVNIGTFPARQKAAGDDDNASAYYATYYLTGSSVTLYVGSSMVGLQSYAHLWYIKD